MSLLSTTTVNPVKSLKIFFSSFSFTSLGHSKLFPGTMDSDFIERVQNITLTEEEGEVGWKYIQGQNT